MKKIINYLMMLTLLSMLTIHSQAQINYPVASWVHKSHGAGGNDNGYNVATDASGNSYVIGYISSEFNASNGPSLNIISSSGNTFDIYVAKYNSTGQNIWTFTLGNSSTGETGRNIAVDKNGYIYIGGHIYNGVVDMDPSSNTNNLTGAGSQDAFIAKYDGNYTPDNPAFFKWAFNTRGAGNESIEGMHVDNAGNIYLCGFSDAPASTDLDPSSGTQFLTSYGSTDIYIAKYDGNLTPSNSSFLKWAFSIGSSGDDRASAVIADSIGNVYLGAYISPGTNAVDMNPTSGIDTIRSMGVSDALIIKVNGNLTPANTAFYQWGFTIGNSNYNNIAALAVRGNNVFVSGTTYGSTTLKTEFDPSADSALIAGVSSTADRDMFLAMYDATKLPSDTSFYRWAFIMGSTTVNENLYSMATDTSGNIYLGGVATASFDCDPSSKANFVSGSNSSMFVVKYNITTVPSDTNFYKWNFTPGTFSGSYPTGLQVKNNKLSIAGLFYGNFKSHSAGTTTLTAETTESDLFSAVYDLSLTPSVPAFCTSLIKAGNNGTGLITTAATTDKNGNTYVAGNAYGYNALAGSNNFVSINSINRSLFIAKYNPDGTLAWGTTLPSNSSGVNIDVTQMHIDTNNNLYIGGTIYGGSVDVNPSVNNNFISSSSSYIVYIVKYKADSLPTSTSFYQWSYTFGGSGSNSIRDIKADNAGNVYIAATISGGSAISVNPTTYTPLSLPGSNDAIFIKYDGTKATNDPAFYKWAFVLGGPGSDFGTNIIPDSAGNVYIGAGLAGTTAIDINPTTDSLKLTPASTQSDELIAKYDGTLTPSNTSFFKWGFLNSGTGNEQPSTFNLGANNSLYVSGYFASATDFDPSTNTNSLTPTGSSLDAHITKYNLNVPPTDTSFHQWSMQLGNSVNQEIIKQISFNSAGHMYVLAEINGSAALDMDPSTNTSNLSGATTLWHAVACYDANLPYTNTGFYKWAFNVGGVTRIYGLGLNNNNMTLAGYFSNSVSAGSIVTVDFQPGAGLYSMLSARNGSSSSAFIARYVDGVIWTGANSNNWNTAGNWSANSVPTSTQYAYIPATGVTNEPTISSNNTIFGLAIDTGRTLTINSGNTLNVTNTLSNNSTITGAGKISLSGTQIQYISGRGNISNLQLNNGAGAVMTDTQRITDTYTPTSGTLTTGGFLTLKSTAIGTARIAAGNGAGGYISGVVNTERYIPGKRAFRFLSHPFTTAQSMSVLTDDIDITGSGGSPFTSTATNNPSAFYFDVTAGDNSTTGNNPGWTAYTASSTWAQYQAMRVLVRGAKGQGLSTGSYTPSATTIDMSGSVNQGNQTISLTKGSGTNFVLVGNPFPSQVNMDAVSGTNIGSSFYIWDANQGTRGAYTSYTFGSSSFNLPCGGAFVTTLSANGSIVFEEADKTNSTAGAPFKTTGITNQVELKLEDSTIFWDRLLLNFDDNAMATVDYPDAAKLYNPDMTFYTLSKDDSMLSIDTRPYVANETIKLGLYAGIKKDFKFTAPNVNMPAGTKLYFTDKLLSKTIEVTPAFEYWFTVDSSSASWGNNRFELNTQGVPTNSIANVNASKLKVKLVPNPTTDNVTIYYEGAGKELNIVVTNIMGVKVANVKAENVNGNVTIPTAQLANGIYNITIYNGSEVMTQKLIKQ